METWFAIGDARSRRMQRRGKAALGLGTVMTTGLLAIWATASAQPPGAGAPTPSIPGASVAQVVAEAPAPPPAFQECAVCHGAAPDAPPTVGPNLWNVGGRKAGAADYPYSAAMKASNIVWTIETLQAYIAQPKVVVPGTTMEYQGLTDPAAAQAVTDYLMSLKG